MRFEKTAAWLVAAPLLALPAGLSAQQAHVVDRQAIRERISTRAETDPAARRRVQNLLERDEIRRIAAQNHIDIERLHAGVATLTGPDLEAVASRTQMVESSLAGGDTIVITTTTLIIILLVLIIILVA